MKVEELNDLFAAPEDVVEVINEEVEETGNNGVDDSPEDGDTNKTEEVTNEELKEMDIQGKVAIEKAKPKPTKTKQ